LMELDGKEFMGRNLRVQLGTAIHQGNPVDKEQFVQLHISFISKQVSRASFGFDLCKSVSVNIVVFYS
jgi:hypothetical protein